MSHRARVRGRSFTFHSLKEVLAKANERKSGDELAGLAAGSELERVAAKRALAEVTLEALRLEPAVPPEEDECSAAFEEALDDKAFAKLASWSVQEFRDWLLDDATSGEAVSKLQKGFTPEMAAAAVKLMSNLDLIVLGRKLRVVTRCNNTLGLPGRLSSRLQPNHPADSLEGILLSTLEGLTFGCGDACIGINPAGEGDRRAAEILKLIHELIERFGIPTQNCVLAHLTSQLRALTERRAPVDLFFQSVAGSEAANRSFGVDLALLREAHAAIREEGTARGPNRFYFETGQGSALSSGGHHGADQVTMEARAHGVARLFDPFIVNTVVGFIGPEYLYDGKQIARAGLEDHAMGKLLGLPMGCDVCYTNHAEADQNDLESLAALLTAAGCTYFMALPQGDDSMLMYQSSAYHDIAALREVFALRPAPEFEAWLEGRGLMKDGRLLPGARTIEWWAGQPALLQ